MTSCSQSRLGDAVRSRSPDVAPGARAHAVADNDTCGRDELCGDAQFEGERRVVVVAVLHLPIPPGPPRQASQGKRRAGLALGHQNPASAPPSLKQAQWGGGRSGALDFWQVHQQKARGEVGRQPAD